MTIRTIGGLPIIRTIKARWWEFAGRLQGQRWLRVGKTAAQLGECPRWSTCGRYVFWVDISGGRLIRSDVLTGNAEERSWPDPVAALTLTPEPGRLCVTVGNELLTLADTPPFRTIATRALPFDARAVRGNDASWGPDSTLWIACMPVDGTGLAGGLVSVSAGSARWHPLATSVVNGPVVSGSAPSLTLALSAERRLARLAVTNGVARRPDDELLVSTERWPGYPDGIACDSNEELWVAHYDGGLLTRWTTSFESIGAIRTPCSCPTALAIRQEQRRWQVAVTAAQRTGEPGGLWILDMAPPEREARAP